MLREETLVSVIITCYNQEKFIGEAIESVLKQTYRNWECWIVDDGSEDGSPAVITNYVEQDGRIQFIRLPNSGVAAARNIGYLKSSGRYIQFLDGDDWILPEKLEQQVAIMEAHPQYGVSYTAHEHYWQASGNFAKYSFEVLKEQPLEQLLYGYDRGVSIPIHTALIRKDVWAPSELPFPEDYPHRYEDWVFWVRIALKQTRFNFLNQPFATYRMHGQNFTKQPEVMASHAIQAVIYIGRMLPEDKRAEFETGRINLILSSYAEQKNNPDRENSRHLGAIFKLLDHLLRLFKRVYNKVAGKVNFTANAKG